MRDATIGCKWRRVACAVGLLAILASGCGDDSNTVNYDCCLSNVWYGCSSAAAYGRCLNSDPLACIQRNGACPPGANK